MSTLFLLLLKPSCFSPWWPSLSVHSRTCDGALNMLILFLLHLLNFCRPCAYVYWKPLNCGGLDQISKEILSAEQSSFRRSFFWERDFSLFERFRAEVLLRIFELIQCPQLCFGCRTASDTISHGNWLVTHLLQLPMVWWTHSVPLIHCSISWQILLNMFSYKPYFVCWTGLMSQSKKWS